MHGLGDLAPAAEEPVFHEPWEARALALTLAAGAWGRWTLDASRLQRERIPGPSYLAMSYYEKWIAALEALLTDSGLVTAEELRTGRPAPGALRLTPPLTAAAVPAVLAAGGPTERPPPAPARFAVNDRVRVRNRHPQGHTRAPRYVRGREGTVHRLHGAHVFPDSNAHGRGENPHSLYSVRFEAPVLWGEAFKGSGAVYLDLWEDYLERA
jgi:nitrile hydratase